MKLTREILPTAMLLSLMSSPFAHAADDNILGAGRNACSNYIEVVDGQWSNPLNAIHFHGYISWAHGLISGHNRYGNTPAIQIDTDTLKMSLIDRCREQPDSRFSSAVDSLIADLKQQGG